MTTQIKDTLLYNDKVYYLNDYILEKYFREFPNLKPEFDGFDTAMWRGYVASVSYTHLTLPTICSV